MPNPRQSHCPQHPPDYTCCYRHCVCYPECVIHLEPEPEPEPPCPCAGQQCHIPRRAKSVPDMRDRAAPAPDPWADFLAPVHDEYRTSRHTSTLSPRQLRHPIDYLNYSRLFGRRFIYVAVRTYDGQKCVLRHPRPLRNPHIDLVAITITIAKRTADIVANFFRAVHAMEDERYRRHSKRSRRRRSYFDFFDGWDIQVNVPIRYYNDSRHDDSSLIEPFVENICEFNADDGWVRDSDSTHNRIMQALSYYSYGYSDGKYLLCNLKGGFDFKRKVITICNPALMSRGRGGEFGTADIGERAIRRFFRSHDCCGICKAWPKPSGRPPICIRGKKHRRCLGAPQFVGRQSFK